MLDDLHRAPKRTHNLKGIDVDVPKQPLVAFTGVSVGGKSSLVFDTICIEAQRQLVETLARTPAAGCRSSPGRRSMPSGTSPPAS